MGEGVEPMRAGIRVSDDPAELDRELVHRWLSEESYWAHGRERDRQEAAIDGSWNFGAYDAESGVQLGYARVVTDRATFAWLCDVFVAPDARGRGIGVALVGRVVAALDELGLRRVMLATADAHGLYARFGFEPITQPERWMARQSSSPGA